MSHNKPDPSSSVVLESESRPQFEALVAALTAHYRPVNQPERALIDRMAAARWLQMRTWAALRRALDTGVPAGPSVLRVEAIHRRQFNSARGELLFLQDHRQTENVNWRFGPDPKNGHSVAAQST